MDFLFFFNLIRKYCCDAIVATKCVHFESLCNSMNFLFFFNLSRKYCCDAIVATKCVHFESVNFDAIKYSQAMDVNTDYYITKSTLASRHHGSLA